MFEFKNTKEIKIKLKEDQYNQISNIEKINSILKDNEAFGYDIYRNDDLIGFAMLQEFENGCFFLWDYAIDYRFQNKHYGTDALNELIEYLKEKTQVRLITVTYIYGNKVAARLYEKAGFKITDIYNQDNVHEVNMMLKIK